MPIETAYRELRIENCLSTISERAPVPAGAGRFREHAHVFLERGDEIRHDLERHDDLRPHRCAHYVVGLRRLDVFFREGQHLAEREREIKWGVGDRAEVRVGARQVIPSSSGTMVKLICLRSFMSER